MLVTKKMLVALTLVGAIVGAGIGSLATKSQTTAAANMNFDRANATMDSERSPEQIAANNAAAFRTTEEQAAYRQGFDAGFSACDSSATGSQRQVVYEPSRSSSSR